MHRLIKVNIVIFVLGVIIGPFLLTASNFSQAPLIWVDVITIVVGSFISGLFVVGVQILRKNPKNTQYTLLLFELLSVFTLGSGVGGILYAMCMGEFSPSSTIFFAVGLGLFISVVSMHFFYKSIV